MIRYLTLAALALALAGAVPARAEVFVLADHVHEYVPDGSDCSVCHVQDASEFIPSFEVCLECHEEEFLKTVTFSGTRTHGALWSFDHRQAAKLATHDKDEAGNLDCFQCHRKYQKPCLECHAAGFADEMGEFGNNLANVHRSDFKVSHPIAARTDPQRCEGCHQPAFCVDCHDDFNRADLAFTSHRRGWSDLQISPSGPSHALFADSTCQNCHPDSVLPSHDWSGSHAREARKNLVTCQACHPEGDVCLRCHSARTGLRIDPHPDGWDDMKGRLKSASNGKTCRKCH
jgi:hypothetical protein